MVFGDAEKKKRASLARDGVNMVIKNPSDARALARLVGGGGVSTLSSMVGKRILTYNNPSMGSTVQPKVAPSVSSVSSTLMQNPTIKPSLGIIVQPKVAPSVSFITGTSASVAPTPSYLPVVVGVVILAFVFLM